MIIDNNLELFNLVRTWLTQKFYEQYNYSYSNWSEFLEKHDIVWNYVSGVISIPDELFTFILLQNKL